MKQKYIDIERELVKNYKIVLVADSTCRSRIHAHCDGSRRICKWNYINSVQGLFTLAHEIGHIMTYKSKMRRCESEYYATVWALKELEKYHIKVPIEIVDRYQRYIYMELDRGLKRGGTYYFREEDLDLYNYKYIDDLKVNTIKEPKPVIYKPRKIEL